jgi:hypothetical protein
MKAEELSDWLDRDVCPVVQEVLSRPDFQELVVWPVRRLQPGGSSRERALIEAVDAGLVQSARLLATFAGRHAGRGGPLKSELSGGPTSVHPSLGTGLSAATNDALKAGGLLTIEFIAERPWRDLVAVIDYFGPVADLNLVDREAYLGPKSQNVQVGAFLPVTNPALRPLGDFVTRTLLIRIDYWQSILQRFWVRCASDHLRNPADHEDLWKRIGDAREKLWHDIEDLRHSCSADESAKLRESCIALVQLYAAYRPKERFPWLGLEGSWSRMALTFRHRLERQNDGSVPNQVASAMAEIATLYRSELDAEELIRQKSGMHALVLVEGPGRREAYWHAALIKADWARQAVPWRFLCQLAEHLLKAGRGVDACDFPEKMDFSVKDARYRLKPLIPKDLMDLIIPAGRGTQKLDISPDEVCALRFDEGDRLVSAVHRGHR